MAAYFNVFVNVPHAFTRVRVRAESKEQAKERALTVVREKYARFQTAFDKWSRDETGKVKYPQRPFEWSPVVTAVDVAEHSFVTDEDVERDEEEG
jgi:hypothetical protein